MSKSVQSNDTLLYISNIGICIRFKYRVENRKEEKRERKSAPESEKKRLSNRYHTVDCHAKARRTIRKTEFQRKEKNVNDHY